MVLTTFCTALYLLGNINKVLPLITEKFRLSALPKLKVPGQTQYNISQSTKAIC